MVISDIERDDIEFISRVCDCSHIGEYDDYECEYDDDYDDYDDYDYECECEYEEEKKGLLYPFHFHGLDTWLQTSCTY